MKKCPFCAEQIQDEAVKCKHCGELLTAAPRREGMIECPKCRKQIVPVVTSVGGGSCSVGRRDKFYCPLCGRVIRTRGCLVASATYEDADAYEVLILRQFRDEVLKRSIGGRLVVIGYYVLSPHLARVVECSKTAKLIARKSLDRVVGNIEKPGRRGYRRALSGERGGDSPGKGGAPCAQ